MNLDDHLTHFATRIIRDAFNDATAIYWISRAATFDAARPRPGDYTGRATREQIAEQDARLAAAARACRARAAVLTREGVLA